MQPSEDPPRPLEAYAEAFHADSQKQALLAPGITVPAKQPNRRLRLMLAMGAGIVALLCVGGVGVIISSYDSATEIKRAAPDAVVNDYLRSYLVNRDDKRAALFTCEKGGKLEQIAAYRADIVNREQQYSVGISVSWSGFTVAIDGDKGTVSTELVKTTSDRSGRLGNLFAFSVVDQGGWRVCGATQIS